MFEYLKLRKRVSELEDMMAKLAREMEKKELDWIELRARCKRLLDRTEKAAARVEHAENGVESEQSDTPQLDGGELTLTSLTPAQRRMQQQILLHRARRPQPRKGENDQ